MFDINEPTDRVPRHCWLLLRRHKITGHGMWAGKNLYRQCETCRRMVIVGTKYTGPK